MRPKCLKNKAGAPERIRTSDPQIRSLVLYPAELRARNGIRGGKPPAGALSNTAHTQRQATVFGRPEPSGAKPKSSSSKAFLNLRPPALRTCRDRN